MPHGLRRLRHRTLDAPGAVSVAGAATRSGTERRDPVLLRRSRSGRRLALAPAPRLGLGAGRRRSLLEALHGRALGLDRLGMDLGVGRALGLGDLSLRA